MGALGATVALAVAVVAAAAWGMSALAVVTVVVGVVAVFDGTRLLQRAGARPVLPATLVPVVGLPAAAAANPAEGMARIASWYAAAFLLAAGLLVISGRRQHAAMGLGGTMALSGLVGLGVVALVLLAGLPDGQWWLVAVVGMVAGADIGDRLARLLLHRRGAAVAGSGPRHPSTLAAVAGVLFAGSALITALDVVIAPLWIAAVGIVVAASSRGSVALWPWFAGDRVGRRDGEGGGRRPLAPGQVLATCGTLLLAAPVSYLLARLVAG